MFIRMRSLLTGQGLAGVLVGALLTMVLTGTAIAVTDSEFTYSTPQTGYLMVQTGDLVPIDAVHGNAYALHPFLGAFHTGPAGTTCFRGGVHLPQGAVMRGLRTWYLSQSSGLSWELGRTDPATGGYDVLVARGIEASPDPRSTVNDPIPAGLRSVNNARYLYTLTVCVTNSARWYAARITYTYTSAGD